MLSFFYLASYGKEMIDPIDTAHEATGDEPEARIIPNTAVPFGTGQIGAAPGVLPGVPIGTEGPEGRPSGDDDEIWHYHTKAEVDGELGIHEAPESWHREGSEPEGSVAPGQEASVAPDSRGLLERIADTVTGDRTHDETGRALDEPRG